MDDSEKMEQVEEREPKEEMEEVEAEELMEESTKDVIRKRLEEMAAKRRESLRGQQEVELWVAKTKLGRLVHSGEITTMAQALRTGLPIREPEIVDFLLPDLEDEVLSVNMVQRMTDSGRRTKFAVVVVVGNKNGYVGLGEAKGKEVGPTIRKAIDNAKLNIFEIRRGCGSWECGCMTPHSLPYVVRGKSSSVEVTLYPAPRGIGLAVNDVAKKILKLAGIKDAWGFSRGQTKTTVNNAKAVIDALKQLSRVKVPPEKMQELKIVRGSIGGD